LRCHLRAATKGQLHRVFVFSKLPWSPRRVLKYFNPSEADLFAGAFEDTGPTTKAVSSVIRDRMIDQYLPGPFDIEQRLIRNEP
jgi:hypothetical protein